MIRIQLDSPRNEPSVFDAMIEMGLEDILQKAGGGTISFDARISVSRGSPSAQDDAQHREDDRPPT